jgi:hypothetical protein
MNALCDGGGNRYLTKIDLTQEARRSLKAFFSDLNSVVPGVCSIIPTHGQPPWIVCPRRLLVFSDHGVHQNAVMRYLFRLLNYPVGTQLGIWQEVKVRYQDTRSDKLFDYTFDYVLMPIADVALPDKKAAQLSRRGFRVSGSNIVHSYPVGQPSIVEIMTSSTSGGNRARRTQIPQAFEDALLVRAHKGPGINYRQVWARMVSQLLVKSEVAHGWGGKAIWVVQDMLVDYIQRSTGLDIYAFANESPSQVNLLSVSYGDLRNAVPQGILPLSNLQLFAGDIGPKSDITPSFLDIVRLPTQPPLARLIEALTRSGAPQYQLSVAE